MMRDLIGDKNGITSYSGAETFGFTLAIEIADDMSGFGQQSRTDKP